MTEKSPPPGVIIPPPEMCEVISKTAGYVKRNGSSFETRIKTKEQQNAKFSFLQDHDPYHAYYKWSLSEPEANASKASKSTATAKSDNVIPKPRALSFIPPDIPVSNVDAEIIKTTALFVAKNGKSYISALKKHVEHDSQFEFLNERNSLNKLFFAYVAQFVLLINKPEVTVEKFEENCKNITLLLDSAFQRAEYDKKQENEQKSVQSQLEKERMDYASIDWQDFFVAETIEFTAIDKVSELPLPLNIVDLQYRSLRDKAASGLLEEAPPDYEPEVVEEQPVKREINKPRTQPKGMKVRSAGETRIRRNQSGSEKMLTCPLTGRSIPASKFQQHITILLRDPKYKEEKTRYEAKTRGSNLTSDQVYENVKNLVEKKSFAPEHNAVQWDGYKRSAEYVQKKSMEEPQTKRSKR